MKHTVALLLVCVTSGCTTASFDTQKVNAAMEADVRDLQQGTHELARRLEAVEALQTELHRDMRVLGEMTGQKAASLARRVAELEREIEALNLARVKDREGIVNKLSEKIVKVMENRDAADVRDDEYGFEHVVQSGETLSAIAVVYGVKVDDIVHANSLKNPNAIRVGQTLFVPKRTEQ